VEKVGKILAGEPLGRAMRQHGNAAAKIHQQERVSNGSYYGPAGDRYPQVANDQEPVEGVAETQSDPSNERRIAREHYSPVRRRRIGVRSDLTKVKAILSKVLSHRGLDKRVERYEFILHWPEIVGERLAEVSRPECIRNRALIVNVIHPVWAQELAMIKPVLLESLAKYLKPGDIVQDMVFRIHTP
jgi:predicted nucleic acid-binding Zn ribbon protein